MYNMLINRKQINIIILFLSFFTLFSCKKHKPVFHRQDVSNNIFFLETPVDASIGYVMQNSANFTELKREYRSNLNRALKNPNNLLWLKIDFVPDTEFKDKTIALYISQLQSSSWLWCNGNSIRKYGSIPPHEISCGTVSHFFMFPKPIINYEGNNTIYIQVWPGPLGMISNTVFIGEQQDVFTLSERHTFFNAKITIAFMTIMILIFVLYLLLYIVLHKNTHTHVYLYYSLLSLFTSFFLIPFCISEISWAIPPFIPYFLIIKICLNISAQVTVFFANSFMLSYLKIRISKKALYSRIIFIIIPSLIILCIPNYKALSSFIPFQLFFCMLDFFICTPKLIKSFLHKNKKTDSLKLTIGFMPVLLCVLGDILIRGMMKIDTIPYITLYGWQITIYIFLFYLVQEFGTTFVHNLQLKSQVEQLNSNLEEIVAIRTKELSEANYVLSKGLESVAQVQKNVLPPKEKLFKGWDFSAIYCPLDNNVSGDFYDFYYTEEKLDGIGIFDVSGHGITAGLMTILSKGIITQHFVNGLEQKIPLTQVLEEINETYIKEKVNVDNYITGLLFTFSTFDSNDVCHIQMVNAGHPYPLFYDSKNQTVTEIKYENQNEQYGIIGIEGLDVSFPTVNFEASINDVLVCFTDGITEAMNVDNKDFSKDRIIEILEKNAKLSAHEIGQMIMSELEMFTKGTKIHDDITLIVLKRNNSKNYIEGILKKSFSKIKKAVAVQHFKQPLLFFICSNQ